MGVGREGEGEASVVAGIAVVEGAVARFVAAVGSVEGGTGAPAPIGVAVFWLLLGSALPLVLAVPLALPVLTVGTGRELGVCASAAFADV